MRSDTHTIAWTAHTRPEPKAVAVGILGPSGMCADIARCLRAAGHQVVIADLESVAELASCRLVLVALDGTPSGKRNAMARLEATVEPDAVIGVSTSRTPVTELQRGAVHPERVVGVHWAEPAHVSPFMEIVCGGQTDPAAAAWVRELAVKWGKDPGIVSRDVPGFIANRCMYALLREACRLVDAGVCKPEDVDRSLRNDLGCWIGYAGPFRFMDIEGVEAFAEGMRELWPELGSSVRTSQVVERTLCGEGTFYSYSGRSLDEWRDGLSRYVKETRTLVAGLRPERVEGDD